MKYLPPLILTEAMYAPIENIINETFEKTILYPLRAALHHAGIEIRNSHGSGLERAFIEGIIFYRDGRIYGRFNAVISKELKGMGAVYDKRNSSWKLPANTALPARLQIAIAEADARARKASDAVIKALDGINIEDQRTQEEIQQQYGQSLWRMNEAFVAATKSIAIAPEFTQAQKDAISREWATNLDLYIKNWESGAILELRQKVESNAARGQRAENLVKMIQETHNVSKSKAKFLARQETSLLMSKMREERYKDIGVVKYRWNGANDARERPDHKLLNGQIFPWDQPPITNRETGARNNPGEDFGCRCIAIPILE